ncbi:methyltransferase domain-containing protein [Streptomyces sp. CoH17]|uniref:methyltransferase domain-containing protein n=1 Tax=Streptomyces sp. CoH17 TaxID=2992806 RepID=UPI00227154B2|nr:methyltransferase domain-containing protein [Streptomyces sp. CoH17]
MSEEFTPVFGKKAMDSQEARNEYWNSVSHEKMETTIFRKRSRQQTLKWYAEKTLEASPKVVLDLGCGYSDFLDYLTEAGYEGQYQGADPAIEIVYKNTQKWPHQENPKFGWWNFTSEQALQYIEANTKDAGDRAELRFDPDVITFVNVHGSFKKSEALSDIEHALRVAQKRVIVTNLDEELYKERMGKSTHKFQSFSGRDYAMLAPEEWAFETGILGTRHRYAIYTKVL